jgi:hypothetical protein
VPLPLIPALCAACCLVLFTAIAGVDGLYFHLYKYKLYARPQSRYEHRLHTINSVMFVPLTALLFCAAPAGLFLWLGLLLFLGSLLIEILDVLCEPASRRDLGGLIASEYLMHFLMSGLRFGAIVPLLSSPPPAAWLPSSTALGARPFWLLLLGAWIALPGIGIAALHIRLDTHGVRKM